MGKPRLTLPSCFLPSPKASHGGNVIWGHSFNRVFSCGWGQGRDSCSVCLCLKYGPHALKVAFVSTDGLYGVPQAASSL